jgi:hypothetical protein
MGLVGMPDFVAGIWVICHTALSFGVVERLGRASHLAARKEEPAGGYGKEFIEDSV